MKKQVKSVKQKKQFVVDCPLRIGIVGASGTGKSSLAHALADALNVKFIESKVVTREILVRDGYDYGSGIQIERFLANSSRQSEILKKTILSQKKEKSFVADRTVIDLASYAVAELHDADTALLKKIMAECQKNLSLYTHVLLCPWNTSLLSNNNKRTLNPWYQFMIHALQVGIMEDWGVKYQVIQEEETKSRVEEVVEFLKLKKS